jgi:hypothetical protein
MQTNPAQRLHDHPQAFRQRAENTVTIGSVWVSVFDIPGDDFSLMFEALSELAALPNKVDQLLRQRAGVDESLFIEPWLAPVKETIAASRNFGNPSTHVSGQYNEVTLLSLRHASHELRQVGHEMPDAEGIPEIYVHLSDLEDMILGSTEVDPELAEFLLRHVDEMKKALRIVRLTGPEGVRSAIAGSVGEMVLRKVEGKELPDPETPVGKKWSSVLTKMGEFVAFGNGAIELGTTVVDGAQKMLPG